MELLNQYILNELQNLVVVASPNGQLRFVNKHTYDLLGMQYTRSNLFENRHYLQNARSVTSQIIHELDTVKAMQGKNQVERAFETVDGQTRWIMWNVSRSADGNYVGIGYDITDQKMAEMELKRQALLLRQQQQEVVSSIRYAQTIQEALLPDIGKLHKYFEGAFVLYKPRDIVSGDFYWISRVEQYVYIAVADCTGHGVPGAMMAVMGNSFLNNAVKKHGITECDQILYEMDQEIQVVLNQRNKGARDGMDISLIRIDLYRRELQFSGAMRSAFLMRSGELIELKAAKYPLGFFDDVPKTFVNHEMDLLKNDRIFLFTDGYVDQFGGENNKKFNRRRFCELLLSLGEMDAAEQQHYLDYVFQNWKQDTEQTDDVTILGITI